MTTTLSRMQLREKSSRSANSLRVSRDEKNRRFVSLLAQELKK